MEHDSKQHQDDYKTINHNYEYIHFLVDLDT